jgi:cobalamin biosynthesis Co2+ chelatase CbiK
MEESFNNKYEQINLLKKYYRPDYSQLFNKIKDIKTPVKNEILMCLLDGSWHSELDLIRIAKKKQKFMGAVTLGTMVNSLNHTLKNDYVERKVINGKMFYKISDNYVGLTRAAYNKYRFQME